MSRPPSGSVHLAWVVRVDVPTLCASLQAYTSTKPAITAFKFCSQKSDSSSKLLKLPQEIVNLICEIVSGTVLLERLPYWTGLETCLRGECPLDSPQRNVGTGFEGLEEMFRKKEYSHDDFYRSLTRITTAPHQYSQSMLLDVLNVVKGKTKKYNKVPTHSASISFLPDC